MEAYGRYSLESFAHYDVCGIYPCCWASLNGLVHCHSCVAVLLFDSTVFIYPFLC